MTTTVTVDTYAPPGPEPTVPLQAPLGDHLREAARRATCAAAALTVGIVVGALRVGSRRRLAVVARVTSVVEKQWPS